MVGVIWYRIVRCGGTDWSDTLVPIRPLQWYRFIRCCGTDWSDALVPIHPLQWYRFADIITLSYSYQTIYELQQQRYCFFQLQRFLSIVYFFHLGCRRPTHRVVRPHVLLRGGKNKCYLVTCYPPKFCIYSSVSCRT